MIPKTDIQRYLQLSIELATEGGKLAKSLVGKTQSSRKMDKSIVTEADRQVQDFIVGRLAKEVPSHGLIAEEDTPLTAGRPGGEAEFVWTIDPIDGTRNYAAGVGLYSCSVALLHQGRPVVGAIYEPNFHWLFSAAEGQPTEFNHQPASVKDNSFSFETVFGISINTYSARPPILHHLLNQCMLRNLGSTALHLGMVGAGLIDGAIHLGGKLWDIGAGALIVQQAGGTIYPVDDNGNILKTALWPMDLANYHDAPLPFITGQAALLEDIEKSMNNG
jgi:myo-inositol-1(or 4)-monophosphatase